MSEEIFLIKSDYQGDVTKQICLRRSMDYKDYSIVINTRRYRTYVDINGETKRTPIGNEERKLMNIYLAFGALYIRVNHHCFVDRGFQQWEREVCDKAREDPITFVRENFGVEILELPFETTVSISAHDWNNHDSWDNVHLLDRQVVPFKFQCTVASDNIERVLDAQRLLVDNLFIEEAQEINDLLEKKRDVLKELLKFKDVHIDTPFADIPDWVWKGDTHVCKERRAKLAEQYEHVLKKEVVKADA